MAETEYSNELYHYGVLGMKWVVRRAAEKARSEPKLKKRALNYDKKSAKLTKKKVAKKAAKTRLKLANNQRYINMTKRRVSDIQSDPKYQATIAELRKKYGSVIG